MRGANAKHMGLIPQQCHGTAPRLAANWQLPGVVAFSMGGVGSEDGAL